MDTYNVMLTTMGGYGAMNFMDDVQRSAIGNYIHFFGTHADPYLLARSEAKVNYLVPWAKNEDEYIEVTKRHVINDNIDLFIPKSDREMTIVSKNRNDFKCNLFIPEEAEIQAAQDKYSFSQILKEKGIGVAETEKLSGIRDIEECFKRLPKRTKYWVRVKTGGEAGAFGATWVENVEQALMWIKLWYELRGILPSEFTISEFLPGRLFECLLIYYKGELRLAKVYENIQYYGAGQNLSSMGSTPSVAKSCADEKAISGLRESIKAVEAIAHFTGTKPNGVYHLSSKENIDGKPCITESNIGRFPSTNACFSRTGVHNAAEVFMRLALGLPIKKLDDPFDIDHSEIYMVRSIDKEMMFIPKEKFEGYIPV